MIKREKKLIKEVNLKMGMENGLIWEYCFDQGNSLHCTLYAISRAVCNSSKRYGKRINFIEILEKLRWLLTLQDNGYPDKGWFPCQFDDLLLPDVCYRDLMGNEEDLCSIGLKVTKLQNCDVNPYQYEDEFVLVHAIDTNNNYEDEDIESHCMQAICQIQNETDGLTYFLCRDSRDSGSRFDRYRHIRKDKLYNELYMVSIQIKDGMEDDIGFDMSGLSLDGKSGISTEEDVVDHVQNPSMWKASNIGQQYIPSSGRMLQCISYAVSECCKELDFYVHPQIVQAYFLKMFLLTHKVNLLEVAVPPEAFNKSIIYINTNDVQQKRRDDIDPNIKIMVLKDNTYSYSFSKEYIYSQKGTSEACYYVLCKSSNGTNDYFVCRDIAAVLGFKHVRLPWKPVDDHSFCLYKVMVNNDVWEESEDESMDY